VEVWKLLEHASEEADTERIDLGARVREIRESRRLSVRKLAALSGVSASFISQFERGLCDASIGTLRKIAQVLGLTTADLFNYQTRGAHNIVRATERSRLSTSGGTRKYILSTPPAHYAEVYLGEIDPGASTSEEAYSHGDSTELLFVIHGSVEYQLGQELHRLSSGDSIEHSTSVPHRFTNTGDDEARVIWVVAPPSTQS
jgi:transcriptional regulator with XRE-family HTH domain